MLAAAAAAEAADAAAARKPNIVVLLADDLGYGETGCQGNPEIPTPNIDSIAADGIRCTNGYVTAPVCSPSRAGFMTGRYQTRFGHELNAIGAQNLQPGVGLPLKEATFADRLQAAGYATGAVGKWHLGGSAPYYPQRRGFDEFFGFLHEGHFYARPPYTGIVSRLRPNEPPYDADNPVLRGTQPVEENEYLTEALTREALGFIERHRQQPFFLYVPYNAVHSPMQAAPKYLKRFGRIADEHRRIFAAMLSALDDSIGAVLGKLHQAGLEEKTLIFFFSDNGGPTAELTSSNKPLSGGKGQLLEGGIRIPFLVQWKGHLPAGKVYEQPVISLDILPTALAAAGAPAPESARLDGVNLLPYLTGANSGPPHERLFWRYGPQGALRKGNWKLYQRGSSPPQLFDLSTDIGEQNNLAEKKPQVLGQLQSAWKELDAQMLAPLWGAGAARKAKQK
jgi:arylsulfatase B